MNDKLRLVSDELLPGERRCDHCDAILAEGANDCQVLPEPPYRRVYCQWTRQEDGKVRRTVYPEPCVTPLLLTN